VDTGTSRGRNILHIRRCAEEICKVKSNTRKDKCKWKDVTVSVKGKTAEKKNEIKTNLKII
jgi:hypothetical protein